MSKNNISKSITFTHEDKTYTLEFNRRSVERMERAGFIIDNITTAPLTTIPMLFNGAFYMHHKGITRDTTDEILKNIKNITALIGKLGDMYSDPVLALLGDDEEAENEKNVTWEANW